MTTKTETVRKVFRSRVCGRTHNLWVLSGVSVPVTCAHGHTHLLHLHTRAHTPLAGQQLGHAFASAYQQHLRVLSPAPAPAAFAAAALPAEPEQPEEERPIR